MKNWKWFFVTVLTAVVFSCAGSTDDGEDSNNILSDITESLDDGDGCSKVSVDNWDSFIGIPYGTNELDLEKKIGDFTGGEYAPDSSSFIYYFKRVERAPITVWVNGKTGKVETIFMEVLGFEEFFDQDLKDVQEEFDIDDCDMKFMGIEADELIKVMGKPSKDESTEEGVRSIFYDSEGLKIAVNFKFYESQGGRCSSISLNWFY
ncbi:MAG: hypothetical protein ACI857_003344 [Arenicella sp.]|jgi:hypothetical protein